MDVIEKFLNEVSWKFDKGYPDITNEQDILMLERLLKEYNVILNEAPSQDILDGIEILKQEFNLADEDFVAKTGKTYKVLVPSKERKEYSQKISQLDDFELKGDNKISFKNNATFEIKPKDSSESYNIKPQNVGVKGDYEYSISELIGDVEQGINKATNLTDLQKKYLIQYLNNDVNLTPEETAEITSDTNFINQVTKNFAEISGAIWYVEEKLDGGGLIEFPMRGNEPLVDSYVIKPNGSRTRISSKAKAGGNIVKPEGLLQATDALGYEFKDSDKEFIMKTINNNSVIPVNLILSKYGDDNVKQMASQLKQVLETDPKLKTPENRQLQYNLEKELIRQINNQFDFSYIFNDLLNVVYVKTATSKKTAIPQYFLVDPGAYKVKLNSKNTSNPSRSLERIGWLMKG